MFYADDDVFLCVYVFFMWFGSQTERTEVSESESKWIIREASFRHQLSILSKAKFSEFNLYFKLHLTFI